MTNITHLDRVVSLLSGSQILRGHGASGHQRHGGDLVIVVADPGLSGEVSVHHSVRNVDIGTDQSKGRCRPDIIRVQSLFADWGVLATGVAVAVTELNRAFAWVVIRRSVIGSVF